MTDEGLEWLREDQRKSGLTIAEYEARYGVMLGSGDKPKGLAGEISRHEVFLPNNQERAGTHPHCAACASRTEIEDEWGITLRTGGSPPPPS